MCFANAMYYTLHGKTCCPSCRLLSGSRSYLSGAVHSQRLIAARLQKSSHFLRSQQYWYWWYWRASLGPKLSHGFSVKALTLHGDSVSHSAQSFNLPSFYGVHRCWWTPVNTLTSELQFRVSFSENPTSNSTCEWITFHLNQWIIIIRNFFNYMQIFFILKIGILLHINMFRIITI